MILVTMASGRSYFLDYYNREEFFDVICNEDGYLLDGFVEVAEGLELTPKYIESVEEIEE